MFSHFLNRKHKDAEQETAFERLSESIHQEAILIERIASLEHEQWQAWSKEIAKTENIKCKRLKRWISLWIPYSELDEKTKEQDRVWAREVIEAVTDHIRAWRN